MLFQLIIISGIKIKNKYEGHFEEDQHYAELEIKEDSNNAGKYLLKIMIDEVY